MVTCCNDLSLNSQIILAKIRIILPRLLAKSVELWYTVKVGIHICITISVNNQEPFKAFTERHLFGRNKGYG